MFQRHFRVVVLLWRLLNPAFFFLPQSFPTSYLVQDRLKMSSTQQCKFGKRARGKLGKFLTPPIQCEDLISTRTFLNNYDVTLQIESTVLTVSTILQRLENDARTYCGDYCLRWYAGLLPGLLLSYVVINTFQAPSRTTRAFLKWQPCHFPAMA